MLDENIIASLAQRGVVTDTFRRLSSEKKHRIYRTAVRLFGEYGYDGLPVDRLCREAGISKGSFFQYFPTKTHLLELAVLIFDGYLAGWVAELKAGERSSLARERLLYLYRSLVVNSKLHPSEERFYHFLTSGLHHAGIALEGVDIERHFHQYIAEIIGRGEETGEIRGDFDVEVTGHLVSLIIAALVGHRYVGHPAPHRKTEEYLISFLFDGIKA
ncbi:MAG: TetR/AcrR family transcriptional regulator [Candidatus Zixiibacteriota bacterium]